MTSHDAESRAAMDAACKRIAEIMLQVNNWRDRWRIEIDGCVFKIDIKGYPKSGTERYRKRQEELERATQGPTNAVGAPDDWQTEVLTIASDMEAVADTYSPRGGTKHPAPYMREQSKKLRALLADE